MEKRTATKRELPVMKTARFHQLGEVSEQTKRVWIACHGYGMQTAFFIRKFDCLIDESTVVLAPEGLSRFYLQGSRGRVGASWMTKEDREVDIQDNMNYLSQLLTSITNEIGHCQFELNLLGFSQGAPTICRWFHTLKKEVSKVVVWGSDVPADTLANELMERWETTRVHLVIGKEDEYISEERKNDFLAQLEEAGLTIKLTEYQGDHRIFPEVLESIALQ